MMRASRNMVAALALGLFANIQADMKDDISHWGQKMRPPTGWRWNSNHTRCSAASLKRASKKRRNISKRQSSRR